MPPGGRPPGWTMPSTPPRATRSTWPPKSPCVQYFSGSDDDEHVLVAAVHHIAADGWSITPLARDLERGVCGRCAGQAPDWARLPVQYADYTLWQRAQFGDLSDGDSRIAAQVAYWEKALAGLPERLQLPTDRPYPLVADQRGATMPFSGLPSCSGTSPRWPESTTRPASWWCRPRCPCCCRNGRNSDVAMGFPIAGRRDAALDGLVGFFVNTLVLRVEVAGTPRSPICWPRCSSAASLPTRTRTCPSRCWWSGSIPPAAWPTTR